MALKEISSKHSRLGHWADNPKMMPLFMIAIFAIVFGIIWLLLLKQSLLCACRCSVFSVIPSGSNTQRKMAGRRGSSEDVKRFMALCSETRTSALND